MLLALSRLVNALGMDSPASYGLLIPILQSCTASNQVYQRPCTDAACCARHICISETTWFTVTKSCVTAAVLYYGHLEQVCVAQPDQLNLLEDGLQLWLVALRNAPSPNSGLLSLFPNLAAVMQQSTGLLPTLQCVCAAHT